MKRVYRKINVFQREPLAMRGRNLGRIPLLLFIVSIFFLLVWLFLDLADRFMFSPLIVATRGYREYLFILGVILGLASTFLRKR